MRSSWKLVGLAGLAGVAATGVVIARLRRAQVDYDPNELRERLHRRLEEAGAGDPPRRADPAGPTGAADPADPASPPA